MKCTIMCVLRWWYSGGENENEMRVRAENWIERDNFAVGKWGKWFSFAFLCVMFVTLK